MVTALYVVSITFSLIESWNRNSTFISISLNWNHPQEALLCMTGGVLYITCGSSLINFYEPLLSSSSYPRSTGLALASLHVITGVLLIANSLLVLCTKSRLLKRSKDQDWPNFIIHRITVEGHFAGQKISKPAEVKIIFWQLYLCLMLIFWSNPDYAVQNYIHESVWWMHQK